MKSVHVLPAVISFPRVVTENARVLLAVIHPPPPVATENTRRVLPAVIPPCCLPLRVERLCFWKGGRGVEGNVPVCVCLCVCVCVL